ncbi:hypothetical protein [Deinococcus cellulosilyticus]|uniref:Uncharacterized protein n=1 Tax=Deinococcus cellulosilyticus (strain DSM 18568 / NBRC 106333 / KACC 11606 / 5516J-15) TaxID=1223518 RepID=A0A511NAG5_DEIC1|nr:hypothetical protein [Deinococcus cellulosilyticus]GEM49822.1 hypothetical protein DC3_54570 [Deinococcus cellulosilyticus NBRC 106333 = KACC 11606]
MSDQPFADTKNRLEAEFARLGLNLEIPAPDSPDFVQFFADFEKSHPEKAQELRDAIQAEFASTQVPDYTPKRSPLGKWMDLTDRLRTQAFMRLGSDGKSMVYDKNKSMVWLAAVTIIGVGGYFTLSSLPEKKAANNTTEDQQVSINPSGQEEIASSTPEGTQASDPHEAFLGETNKDPGVLDNGVQPSNSDPTSALAPADATATAEYSDVPAPPPAFHEIDTPEQFQPSSGQSTFAAGHNPSTPTATNASLSTSSQPTITPVSTRPYPITIKSSTTLPKYQGSGIQGSGNGGQALQPFASDTSAASGQTSKPIHLKTIPAENLKNLVYQTPPSQGQTKIQERPAINYQGSSAPKGTDKNALAYQAAQQQQQDKNALAYQSQKKQWQDKNALAYQGSAPKTTDKNALAYQSTASNGQGADKGGVSYQGSKTNPSYNDKNAILFQQGSKKGGEGNGTYQVNASQKQPVSTTAVFEFTPKGKTSTGGNSVNEVASRGKASTPDQNDVSGDPTHPSGPAMVAGAEAPSAVLPPFGAETPAPAALTSSGSSTAQSGGQQVDPNAPTFTPTEILDAQLVTGIATVQGRQIPVVAKTSLGMFVGHAVLDTQLSRIQMEFNRMVKDGKLYEVAALGFESGSLIQGVPATTRDVAYNLAADLLRSGLNGLNTYAQGLANGSTTTFGNGITTQSQNAVPLSTVLAGELGKVFKLPDNTQTFVRVGEIPAGTPFSLIIGILEDSEQ